MTTLALDVPDAVAVTLLLIKAAFALTGVLLLLWHMNAEWPHMPRKDQRARYLLLLAYGVFQVGATTEQIEDGTFGYRHLVALLLSVALAGVAAYSIRCAHKRRTHA